MTETRLQSAAGDGRVIGFVGAAHFTSHYFQLVLPPLFPQIKEAMDVSYTQLGLMLAVLFTTSALGQVAAGFLVDRLGAQRVLPAGIALLGIGATAVGFAPDFPTLVVCAAVLGIGNSVFHPADYSILTARVSPGRMGRAYSVHTIMGTLGWAAAPVSVLLLAQVLGWRWALVTVGMAAIAIAVLVAGEHRLLATQTTRKRADGEATPDAFAMLARWPIVMAFLYFTMLATVMAGVQSFMPTLLPKVQDVSIVFATTLTTVYLVASAVGSLGGGYLADARKDHARIVSVGLAAAAALMLVLGFWPADLATIVVVGAAMGFAMGLTIPSRDMLVRAATPRDSVGRVFGFVYSGLDVGSLIAPVVIGALLDAALPRLAFVFLAATLAVTIVLALAMGMRRRETAAAAGS